MSLTLLWHGMFQGAFKHQVLKKGVDNVYYLKRADFQLPIPPLPTLEIAPEIIPDLREIYGLAADGTIWLNGPVDREVLAGERPVRTLQAVGFGEAEESVAAVDHELGNPFYGALCLSPQGRIFATSNLPGFTVFDVAGQIVLDREALLGGTGAFELPADRPPFWETGAGDVACGPDSFLVGGFPLNRVDHYSYDGKLLATLREFDYQGIRYDLEASTVAKVAFAPDGRIIVTTTRALILFSARGTVEAVLPTTGIEMGSGNPDFHLWIAVDAEGRLWTQYYKGKEVAYAAFALPEPLA